MTTRVQVFTSALYLTTSGVVVGDDAVLVIDPLLLPREIETIRQAVEESGRATVHLLYTHHHWDHIIGGQAFPTAHRLAHRRLPDAVTANKQVEAARRFDENNYVERPAPFEFQAPHELVDDGWTGDLGNMPFTLIHLPGHATDMLGVHLPSEKTLFAADFLSDVEPPMIDGDGSDYLVSLDKVAKLINSHPIEILVPGHGHVAQGSEVIQTRLDADVAYIEEVRTIAAASDDADAAVEAGKSMSYRGKESWPSMVRVHEANMREVHGAIKG